MQSYQIEFDLEDGRIINDYLIYIDISMSFFTNTGPDLAERKPKADIDPLSFMREALKETLFLLPVTKNEINKIIRALSDSATGHDNVSPQFLKLAFISLLIN